MKKLCLFLLISGIVFGCETEISNYKTDNLSNAIIVYGEVDNFSGPYSIRINSVSAYSPYDIREFVGKPILKAEVWIEDDLKNVIYLKEISNGLYQTSPLFKGIIGRKYQLKISTPSGLQIESTVDALQSPPVLSDFSFSFINAEKVNDMRFDLKAAIKDPIETVDYYFVKKQEFIEFMTTCPPPPPPPAPPPPCYFKCWRAPLNTQPILINDFLVNGKNLPITLKPINANDWTDWVVQLDIQSVSKQIFNYWQRQEDQRTIGGGLFDKIPAQIVGNLKCTNNAKQEVLGAFVVSGILKKRMIINRFESMGNEAFRKVELFADFNNLRYKDLQLLDCSKAGWIDYNLGFKLPEL